VLDLTVSQYLERLNQSKIILEKGEEEMDFAEVLSRAWQIIWRHKVLWIFGILAGCVNSGGGSGNANMDYKGDIPTRVEQFFETTPDWQIATYIGIAILIILIIAVLAIFLGTIGRIGLIRGARQSDQDMEAKLSFGELFYGSLPYFWRVFLLNLLVDLVIFVGAMVLAVIIILGSIMTLGIGLVCIIPLLCLLIPMAWFVSLLVEQSNIAIILGDLKVKDGLQRGWEVMRKNPGTMAIMWLILTLGVSLIGGFIIALPMILSLGPLVVSLITETEEPTRSGFIISILCVAAYLPVLLLLTGVLRSYIETAWTLTYSLVTKRPTTAAAEPIPETLPEPPA
jgi:hypothetical protein